MGVASNWSRRRRYSDAGPVRRCATKTNTRPFGDRMEADPRSTVASVASAPNPRCTRIGSVGGATLPRRPPERSTIASAAADAAVRTHGSALRHAAGGRVTPSSFSPLGALASSMSKRAAAAESRRRVRSFCRQRRSSLRMGAGVLAGKRFQSGSRSMTRAIVSETPSPANADCPVSISNSTQPKAQMSERLSTALPPACSGSCTPRCRGSFPRASLPER